MVGKSSELYWGRNQLSCNEGLSSLQTVSFHVVKSMPARHSCMEFAFCKGSCKFTLHGPGMALAMATLRISSLLPCEMGTCHFQRSSGLKYRVLWHGGMRYNIKKLFSMCFQHGCVNKPLIRHPVSVRGSTARRKAADTEGESVIATTTSTLQNRRKGNQA